MFTGIVEEMGTVVRVPAPGMPGAFEVAADEVLKGTQIGDSIAVDGVCLTVTGIESGKFSADVMPETLSRSSLGGLRPGSRVNLERALALGGRLGGHLVSGHIDGVGTVFSLTRDRNAVRVRIGCAQTLLRQVIQKGSIALDGTSLTVSALFEDGFEVSVIPHTGACTKLLDKHPGDVVNLETDMLGKYVRRALETGGADVPESGLPAMSARMPGVSSSVARHAGMPAQGSGELMSGPITIEMLRQLGF